MRRRRPSPTPGSKSSRPPRVQTQCAARGADRPRTPSIGTCRTATVGRRTAWGPGRRAPSKGARGVFCPSRRGAPPPSRGPSPGAP
eukprot:4828473-Pyramimonas_sp.AAC.1